MSRIAYVGHDDVVYAVSPQGDDGIPLSPEGAACTWPTWSTDGAHVAFSGFRSGSNGHGRLGMYLRRLDDEQSQLIFANEPGTDAIARRVPHYALWSPDSRRLAFVAQTRRGGLSLFVHDLSGSGPPEPVIDGGPMYLSWSADSRYLLVHSHRDHYIVDFDDAREARQMPGIATLYMAPSWCPAGNRMAFCRNTGNERQTLIVADISGGGVKILSELIGPGAFSWSPDGRSIALARDLNDQVGYYRGLWLVDVESSSEERITEDPVLCFFWSPDGSKLAYVTPSEGAEGSLRWAIVKVESSDSHYLADFRPTQEQLAVFMFFDQYGQSHSPWSADGRYLIFSGMLGYEAVRSSLPIGEGNAVMLVDVEADDPPKALAKGFLGFWSRT